MYPLLWGKRKEKLKSAKRLVSRKERAALFCKMNLSRAQLVAAKSPLG